MGRPFERGMSHFVHSGWHFLARTAEESFSYQAELHRNILNILWHPQARLVFSGECPDTYHYDNFTRAQFKSFSYGRYSWTMYSHFLGSFMRHLFKNKSVQVRRILIGYLAVLRP